MPAARCACSTSRSVEWWHVSACDLYRPPARDKARTRPAIQSCSRGTESHATQPPTPPQSMVTFYRMGSLLSFSTPTSSRSTRKSGPSGSSARPAAVGCHRSTEPGEYYTVTSTSVCCHHEAQPTKPCCTGNNYALVEVPGERFVVTTL